MSQPRGNHKNGNADADGRRPEGERPNIVRLMRAPVPESAHGSQTPGASGPGQGLTGGPAEEAADLSGILREFARTMVTDFPIQGILDHLVSRIVEIMPITAAGVTLIVPGVDPQFVAASDTDALHLSSCRPNSTKGRVSRHMRAAKRSRCPI